MIRELKSSDLDELNSLLIKFNYDISNDQNNFVKSIVYVNEKVCGVLVYQLIYDRIEIDYIIVRKEERRKGIATDLIKYLIENNTVNNITLEVSCSNDSAIKLYEKLGFIIVAKRKNYYKNEDGYLMEKKLGDLDE